MDNRKRERKSRERSRRKRGARSRSCSSSRSPSRRKQSSRQKSNGASKRTPDGEESRKPKREKRRTQSADRKANRSRSCSSSRSPSRRKQSSQQKSKGASTKAIDREGSPKTKREKKRTRSADRKANRSHSCSNSRSLSRKKQSSQQKSNGANKKALDREGSPKPKQEKNRSRSADRKAKSNKKGKDAPKSSEERESKQEPSRKPPKSRPKRKAGNEKSENALPPQACADEKTGEQTSKEESKPQELAVTNTDTPKSSGQPHETKSTESGQSLTEAAKPETGKANAAVKPVVDIAALKKRLEEDRNKLSILKEHQEWQQHKEAESSVEVREKEFYQGAAGDVLGPGDKFKIVERIGQGHFASVFKCKDIQTGEDYAVKILRASGVVRRAAEDEAKICRRVHEEARKKNLDGIQNIGSLIGSEFEHSGHLCLVFECLKADLRRICETVYKGRGFPATSLQRYGSNLFSALRLLQRLGIVHTDIKPDNLLLSREKDRRGLDYVQLIDFGSAKMLDNGSGVSPEGITFTGYVSPRFYRAPEVFLGQSYDTQVDVWGAGATLFEMATGKILFEGSTSNAVIHSILRVSGQFSVMFSSRGKNSAKHFNRNGDFLLMQENMSALRVPMSEFARPQQPVVEDLEKYMGFGNPEGPPEVLISRLSSVVENCLAVDPIHRSTAESALDLEFFKKGSRR